MNPHNPANISADQLGPNHRFLDTSELDKLLPEGAEYWDSPADKWIPSGYVGLHLTSYDRKNTTYRIPLTLRDRLQREIEEKQELLKIVEAVENGTAEYEHDYGRYDWYKPSKGNQTVESLELFVNKGFKVRIKSTPRTIPWTLESHPDVVCVKRKNNDTLKDHFLVTRWGITTVLIEGYGWVTYTDLHDHWLQCNGAPAGQEVQG